MAVCTSDFGKFSPQTFVFCQNHTVPVLIQRKLRNPTRPPNGETCWWQQTFDVESVKNQSLRSKLKQQIAEPPDSQKTLKEALSWGSGLICRPLIEL